MGGAVTPHRRSVARLYDEEQRVDGRYRWSVGSAQPVCARCGGEIPAGTDFITALVESDPSTWPGSAGADPLEVFERLDHCASCFATADPVRIFAFWRSVVPATAQPRRKTVNLASLRAYFDRLLDAGAARATGVAASGAVDCGAGAGGSVAGGSVDGGVDEGCRALDDYGVGPFEAVTAGVDDAESLADPVGPDSQAQREASSQGSAAAAGPIERQVMLYLLALFLVRRRSLRWESTSESGALELVCRQTGNRYRVEVPGMSSEELAGRMSAFEQLFV